MADATTRAFFPVMLDIQYGKGAIPWAMIALHEPQAKTNHGQSLVELAQRGGLSPAELVAVLLDEKWRDRPKRSDELDLPELMRLVAEYALTQLTSLKAKNAEQAKKITWQAATIEKSSGKLIEAGAAVSILAQENAELKEAIHSWQGQCADSAILREKQIEETVELRKKVTSEFNRGVEDGRSTQAILEIQGQERFMDSIKQERADQVKEIKRLTGRAGLLMAEAATKDQTIEQLQGVVDRAAELVQIPTTYPYWSSFYNKFAKLAEAAAGPMGECEECEDTGVLRKCQFCERNLCCACRDTGCCEAARKAKESDDGTRNQ